MVLNRKPRGYWRYITAAVGWLIIGASLGSNNNAETRQTKAQQEAAQALRDIATIEAKRAEWDARAKDGEECQPGDDKRYSDLCAQWKAADAARLGAILSGLSFAAVLVALWFAFRSNRIAQNMGKAQVRCYLSIEDVTITFEALMPVVSLKVRNSGQSPAKVSNAFVRIGYFSVRPGVMRWSEWTGPISGRSSMSINANSAHPCTLIQINHDLTNEEIGAVQSGGILPMWCEVKVVAVDVFNDDAGALGAFVIDITNPIRDSYELTIAGTQAP